VSELILQFCAFRNVVPVGQLSVPLLPRSAVDGYLKQNESFITSVKMHATEHNFC
jgi:hypothetical protein